MLNLYSLLTVVCIHAHTPVVAIQSTVYAINIHLKNVSTTLAYARPEVEQPLTVRFGHFCALCQTE